MRVGDPRGGRAANGGQASKSGGDVDNKLGEIVQCRCCYAAAGL
jgi:hypothetical protein